MIHRSIQSGPWLAVEIIDNQPVRTILKWIHNQLIRSEMHIYCFFVFFILVWMMMGSEKQDLAWAASQEVKIENVEVRVSSVGSVVLLRVGERAILVFVDPTVAGSIQSALSGEKFSQPLSHDLMGLILSSL